MNPPTDPLTPPEVSLDAVGTVENAATIISRFHLGEKRPAFTNARAQAERLTNQLNAAITNARN